MRIRRCSRGARRRRSRCPSSAGTTRLASWPPTRCAARRRSARRARSASRCAPRPSSALPRSGRRARGGARGAGSRRRRGSSMRVFSSTSARRFGPPGKRTAAREPLLDGLALAARCGARTLERRARAELAAIGVRPRTSERSGEDSLTPSERRVAELAAAGGTNREIAQKLFVTEKTVETHLGRAFRKLDDLVPATAPRRARGRSRLSLSPRRSGSAPAGLRPTLHGAITTRPKAVRPSRYAWCCGGLGECERPVDSTCSCPSATRSIRWPIMG